MLLPPIGFLIAGKYRLESLLGEGGMGAVFRARHELMDKPVAVKWLKPTSGDESAARHRFMQEARAAARIRHPNVVDVYDVGEQDGCLFMVMELLEGQTFADYLEHKGMAVDEALRHLLAAMRGVAAAHAAGITHRDIKPENIFIAADPLHVQGVAKILDFGISKLHDEPQPNLTLAGTTMGTPHYMSYEQIRCMSDVDHRTDIYAFGVLLYQALTGTLPYDGDTLPGIIMQAATGRAVRPIALCPELPPELDELVMKAIALRREDRFQSIDAMINALTRIHLARHSWSSSTERPSWAPGSLAVAAPVLRARAGKSARARAHGPELGRRRAHTPDGMAEPHAVTEEVALPARSFRAGLRWPSFARSNFAPINPWLGLAGAALGVVMGSTLYTHLMTPEPSRAGKASASAPAQPEPMRTSTSTSPARPSAPVSLLADAPAASVVLPNGKEPPLALTTAQNADLGSVRQDDQGSAAPVAPQDKRVVPTSSPNPKPVKPALAGLGVPAEPAPPQQAAETNLPAPASKASQSQTASAAQAVVSPVAHTHRSGPLKLEDL